MQILRSRAFLAVYWRGMGVPGGGARISQIWGEKKLGKYVSLQIHHSTFLQSGSHRQIVYCHPVNFMLFVWFLIYIIIKFSVAAYLLWGQRIEHPIIWFFPSTSAVRGEFGDTHTQWIVSRSCQNQWLDIYLMFMGTNTCEIHVEKCLIIFNWSLRHSL